MRILMTLARLTSGMRLRLAMHSQQPSGIQLRQARRCCRVGGKQEEKRKGRQSENDSLVWLNVTLLVRPEAKGSKRKSVFLIVGHWNVPTRGCAGVCSPPLFRRIFSCAP